MKGTFLENHLQVNLSAYLMQWNNVQFLFFNPPYLGNTTFGVNGPNYHVKGVEGQFTALLSEGLYALRVRLLQRRHAGGIALSGEQYPDLANLWQLHHADHPQGFDNAGALRQSIRRAGHGSRLLRRGSRATRASAMIGRWTNIIPS